MAGYERRVFATAVFATVIIGAGNLFNLVATTQKGLARRFFYLV